MQDTTVNIGTVNPLYGNTHYIKDFFITPTDQHRRKNKKKKNKKTFLSLKSLVNDCMNLIQILRNRQHHYRGSTV